MRFRFIPLLSLALALAVAPATLRAQAVVQPLPGTTDADRLADQIHRLAANPQDMDALIAAGALSIKMDDLTAAAAFYTRADKIDPHSARVKAGEASLLVRGERPGEALRYFAQAESYGLAPEMFAGDRGLAYDLIGDQARAQRDYRMALKQSPNDDETIRRYALSLGISGKQQPALDALAPLLTKTDRGAWRSRAFVLAMNGDVAGAEHIAATMMPGGMAQGLQPFFERLPTLDAIDRAFAVHFGEVRSSPERIADARLAPATTPLPAEPVVVAAVVPTVDPRKARKAHKEPRGRTAPVPAASVQVAQVATLPPIPTPRDRGPVFSPAPVAGVPTRVATVASSPVRSPPPTALASATPPATVPVARVVTPAPVAAATVPAAVASNPTPRPTLAAAAESPATLGAAGVAAPTAMASALPLSSPSAAAAVAPAPSGPVFGPSVAVVQSVPVAKQPMPAAPTAAPLPAPGFATLAAGSRRTGSRRARSEDAVIDRIIAGLSIPASELDASGKRGDATEVAAVDAKPSRTVRGRHEATPVATDDTEPTPAERKAADRKAAATAKALAAKKAAAEAKAAADKEAAKEAVAERKAARSNPERIWVQVAGGANEDDLPKAWAAVKKKAPDAFAGRSGWATPLRATNRVLAGPFKTDADARAFVNALKKKGVSGFAFTSDAGQKIEKLPAE